MSENRVRYLALISLLIWLPSPVWGQDNAAFPDHVIRIYGPSDQRLDMKLKIEKMMGVYLTHPPRRHTSERISIKKDRVTVDVWQSTYGLNDVELQCRAIKWLIFGRTQYGQGGREVLSQFDAFNQVRLRFHEVIRKKNSRRRTKGKERIKMYLEATLKRQHLRTLNLDTLRREMAAGQCGQTFKNTVGGKLSRRYTKQRRKAR